LIQLATLSYAQASPKSPVNEKFFPANICFMGLLGFALTLLLAATVSALLGLNLEDLLGAMLRDFMVSWMFCVTD
jgi:hypothetical protein